MENNKKLLKESFRYIDNNWNALSTEIPQKLVNFWLTKNLENFDLEAINEVNQGAVFMFALLGHKKRLGLAEFSIEAKKLMRLYVNWQMLLSDIAANNVVEVGIEPFKIFDFEGLENLELLKKK